MNQGVKEACERFVHAIFDAKKRSSSQDEFFADKDANHAYQDLFKAIRRQTPAEVEWQFSVFELAGSLGDSVWEGTVSVDVALSHFTRSILTSLDNLSAIDWIACIPLERAFQRFPAFTDFGFFAIVNARASSPTGAKALLGRFRTILSEHCGVTFMPDEQVHDSYLHLDRHYYNKSGNYVPGRPQLVVNTGKGEPRANELLLATKLASVMPLIQLCQIVLDLDAGPFDRIIGPESTKPDGKTFMEGGLIAIPQCCVALNKHTGQADWWGSRMLQYETRAGIGHDPEKFFAAWQSVAVPVLELRDAGAAGKLFGALIDAVRMLASGRYLDAATLTLKAVIATETILSPFGSAGDINERFALLAAALTESESQKKRDKYLLARNLYRQRCHAVHRSRIHGEQDADDAQKQAVGLFVRCLSEVVGWAKARIAKDQVISREAFEEMYLDAVFPGSKSDSGCDMSSLNSTTGPTAR